MEPTSPLLIALLGVLVIGAVLIRAGLDAVGVPALVGYLALGFLVRLADTAWGFVPETGFAFLETLGRIGLIALLFRVGLESDAGKLRDQLGRAGPVWAGSVIGSGLAGYAAARWVLGLALVPSLFTAVALTATSVGVALGVWREMDAVASQAGALLVDTVELDDFSGVLIMGLLFNVAPALRTGGAVGIGAMLETGAEVIAKAALFLAFCYLFARYLERPLTRATGKWLGDPRRVLAVAGTGFLIAALADALGFSFAIGAFFAGLVFSRDPESVQIDASFEDVYALFVPFFFLWLGFAIQPDVLGGAFGIAAVLAIAAIVGKIVGTTPPAVPAVGWVGGLAVGMSVVPRAEITMVVMERGAQLGEWAVSPRLFAAALLTAFVTSALAPIATRWLLRSRPDLRES